MATPVIIIPAYQPTETLVSLVKQLLPLIDANTHVINKESILIVNDGSDSASHPIFEALRTMPGVTVLTHATNLGKGQALKTAFNHFLVQGGTHSPGVITADADGQHLPHDIMLLWTMLNDQPHHFILGVRTFQGEIPWKSRVGNHLTCLVFRLLIGQVIQDTQTGLRAIPSSFLKPVLKISSSGYDFELDMLVLASKTMKIHEMPIQTVYQNNNQGSHFNPFIDSLKIYFVFLRFLAFSIVSGLLDFFAFAFAFFISGHVLASESLARVLSGTCNFLFNKAIVFQSKKKIIPEACQYGTLCVINLIFSYALISSLSYLGLNVYISKIFSLIGLFVANFAIQRLLIFSVNHDDAHARPQ